MGSILLVEDQKIMAETLVHILRSKGIRLVLKGGTYLSKQLNKEE